MARSVVLCVFFVKLFGPGFATICPWVFSHQVGQDLNFSAPVVLNLIVTISLMFSDKAFVLPNGKKIRTVVGMNL
jgi:hypothetical protein